MISVVVGDQFWRRRIDSYPLKIWRTEEVGAAMLLSHDPLLSRRFSLTEELCSLLCHFIIVRENVVVPAMPCAEASMNHTAPWGVERATRASWTAHSRAFQKKPSATPDWGQVQSDEHKQEWFYIPSVSQDLLHSHLPDFLYTAVKPGAWILVLTPFHFLSLQPYRNSWVTSDKNTHKITMKTDVSRKEKPCMKCLLCSAALGRVLVQPMNGRVRCFTAPKSQEASSS